MGVEQENLTINFQNWVNLHHTLPRNIEPILLQRYLQSVRNDLDKAKKLLEYSFQMRNNNPDIFFNNRDPLDKASQMVLEATDMLPLPFTTKDNCRILFYRLSDLNPEKFNFTDVIRMFFMVADVRFLTPDENGTITDGEIPIFDMSGFSLKHLTKTVLSSLRTYMKYTQEAHPVRLKHIHVLNCSPFLDRVMALVKPFMKSEVFKLIHFHAPGSDTLEKFVPKELLPIEYGGKAGHIKDIKSELIQNLCSHRDYLMDESRWKTVKSQKDSCRHEAHATSIAGNFKALTID